MKLLFNLKNKDNLKELILGNNKDKIIFNFLNLYSVYLYKNNKDFKYAINYRKDNSITLADSITISRFLRTEKIRGTDFTKFLMKDKELLKDKRHFFIGLEEMDLDRLPNKSLLERKNIFSYNPLYIKDNKFSNEEVDKIARLINEVKVDYLWVCIGNPKQEILASDLYDKIDVNFIFNIGAALDFILGKKKEAPKFIQRLGLEWLYRFITDFKYSHKKIWKSFIGLFYLSKIVDKNDKEGFVTIL